MWCIPPQEDAAFVSQMEQVLEVYQRPYDPRFPVVNMDEQHKQLIEETQRPIPAAPGSPARVDYEYVRHGSCVVWMFAEPLAGWRDVSVSETRTAVDWAHRVKRIVDDPRYATAQRITLVCDNLNTHTLASLYQAFPPEEALRLAQRIEIVHTPKHGSWLNIAESELSVLTRQCLAQHLPDQSTVAQQSALWTARRNATQIGVDWQFQTADARVKLKRLYPKVKT
jgi:DDE superfamily endonuclease